MPPRHGALACLLSLLLNGCSLHHWGLDSGADAPHNGAPEQQLAQLQGQDPEPKDQPLHLLQLALFEHLSGQFARSNRTLERVKPLLDYLEAMSVMENLGATTLNETLRSYQASPSERALLHQLAMLNFLLESRPGPARVEALQADLLLQRLAIGGPLQGQLASTRLVTGLVYEFNREWDNALIAYDETRRILLERSQPVPRGLTESVARMRQRLGLPPRGDARENAPQPGGELIVLFWQGQVSEKTQVLLRVYNFELKQHISLALPAYPAGYPPPRPLSIRINDQQWHSEPLEDVQQRMREDLARQRPTILAAASARLVAKYRLARQAGQVDSLFGVFVDLALALSEVADRRSWNSLPAHIQLARIPLQTGAPVKVAVAGQQLRLPPDRTTLLLVHGASHRIFSYPNLAERLEENLHD